jgi:DNA polymerase-3 subunit delta
MFSQKRIVWVREYPPLVQDNVKGFGDSQLKVLEEYLEEPNPGTVLIFSSSKVKNDPKDRKEKKTKLNKLLLSKAKCYDFCPLDRPALRAFIEKRFKVNGLEIDRSTSDYIVDISGYYHKDSDYRLMNMDTDLNKMVSLASEKIKREDVDRAILGDMDTYIFDFLDHLSMNHKEDAFLLLHNIIASGSEFFSILGVIISQFELLTEVSELRDMNMDIAGIVREMGIHEFRVKKALQAAGRLGTRKLKKILGQLYSIDTDVKSGNIDGVTALELLIGRM